MKRLLAVLSAASLFSIQGCRWEREATPVLRPADPDSLALVVQEIDPGPEVRMRAGHGFVSTSDPWVELAYESREVPLHLLSGTLPQATRESSPGSVICIVGSASAPTLLEIALEGGGEVRSAMIALPGGDAEALAFLPPDAWVLRPTKERGRRARAAMWKPERFEIAELGAKGHEGGTMRVRLTIPAVISAERGGSPENASDRLGIHMPERGPKSDRIEAAWAGACVGLASGRRFDSLGRSAARDVWRAAPTAFDTSAALGPSPATTLATAAVVACLESAGSLPSPALLAEVVSGRVVAVDLPAGVRRGLVHFRSGALPPRSGQSLLEPGPAWDEDTSARARAFVWGLMFPGDPYRAAAAAGRDASITHSGAGVEGARFAAALVAASLGTPAPEIGELLDLGESFLVEGSDAEAVVTGTREAWKRTRSADSTAAWIELTWVPRAEERLSTQPWSHALPNLGITVLALEAGGGDFARTMRIASTAGLDASTNASTCGAILGARGGTHSIPSELLEPMQGAFRAAVAGAENWRLGTLASVIESVGSSLRFDPSGS